MLSASVSDLLLRHGQYGPRVHTAAVDRTWFVQDANPGTGRYTVQLGWDYDHELADFNREYNSVHVLDAEQWQSGEAQPAQANGRWYQNRGVETQLGLLAVMNAPAATGLDEAPANWSAHLYPNPARQQVTLAAPGQAIQSIVLTNSLGQQVPIELSGFGSDQSTLDVYTLASGLYTATVITNQGRHDLRLVVQH